MGLVVLIFLKSNSLGSYIGEIEILLTTIIFPVSFENDRNIWRVNVNTLPNIHIIIKTILIVTWDVNCRKHNVKSKVVDFDFITHSCPAALLLVIMVSSFSYCSLTNDYPSFSLPFTFTAV